jgi:hypothetical protein
LKKVIKSVLGAGAILASMTTHAAAETCILFLCLGGGGSGGGGSGGGGGGGAPSAPEIDASQGLTAIAVLAVAVLLMRERFLRQRTI